METPPLRYLSAADVTAAMPPLQERLALAETTMRALVADADLPPKIGVHPAPADAFAHAMPAWMRGDAGHGTSDLLGIKWVTGFPANVASGIPAIHALAVLSDATTGLPRAILDAGVITAQRTAAVSGVAIQRWGPPGSGAHVAVIGAGVQARSHLPVIAHLLPDAEVLICDRDADRLAALASEVEDGRHGAFASVRTETEPSRAVEGADLVVTIVSFGPDRQSVPEAAFAPEATIVAVDYDMCVPAAIARSAGLFLTDELGQFLANRTDTQFVGYPDPSATIGEAIAAGTERSPGRVLVTHLGVGLADVVFGDAILRAAERVGIGTLLER
jgi:ornithine cyclodeaminase/alanine dehydrogenase-like protein (mu-crystallin family)